MNLFKLNFLIFLFMSLTLFIMGLYFMYNGMIYFMEWEFLSLNSNSIVYVFLFDWMSLLFMSFVFYISSMVIFYSNDYMSGDVTKERFLYLVILFVISMMLMIVSPNLISILVGWDGLGLVSYCLVIYYQNEKSFNAGMLTVLSNRIGDVCLLIGIGWMLNYGGWNFYIYMDYFMNIYESNFIMFMILIAGMTKSAQIPFSAWLPAAMAAPTPVSALVHSSTLVTAGVYLLIRFYVLMNNTVFLNILLLIGCLTMFMSGIGANYEFDLKKIIALSTLSQLGLMMSILSMGYVKLSFFHLLTHALFKALLFMCAGMIIHCLGDTQDIRCMGKLVNFMPITLICMNISNMALCGLPFLAGFYSKDLILEMMSMSNVNFLIYLLFYISTGLTVSYSVRLIYYSMMNKFNYYSLFCINENSNFMLLGMMGLVFMAIFGGSMLMWFLFSWESLVLLTFIMKFMVIIVIILGVWLGYELSIIKMNNLLFSLNQKKMVNFLGTMWFMPIIFSYGISKIFLEESDKLNKLFDQGWSELLGVQGLYNYLNKNSNFLSLIQINDLKLIFMFFIMFMLFLYLIF
uniref:NADH dehydrogenase subunit 5 n=1 Tax=Inocellia crassicornis TaxID=279416 RepID=UPI0022FD88F9|nr:NADH dehydrogenase subunit 5 [Inocellia crassicornis]WBK02882.1 NADH dehydrogenase subunit 5 [Inocellia crassicornis]